MVHFVNTAFFASMGGLNRQTKLSQLVTKPLTQYSKLTGKDGSLSQHESHNYHKIAVTSAIEFLATIKNPEKDIRNRLDDQRKNNILENRKRLVPIVESIIFLGRQNISLRGHRDDGMIDVFPEQRNTGERKTHEEKNEGNFRELLKYRSVYDQCLKNHLQNVNCRATYISKTTQNDIISCCGELIQDEIIKRVKQSEFYSIMCDETTDINKVSQMSLSVRYLFEGNIREDFLIFVDCHGELFDDFDNEPILSGEVIANTVEKTLIKFGLDFKFCIGISTDGCSVMTSEKRGAVALLQTKLVNATYCPCYNHALNLSISKSSQVKSIQNAVAVMKEVIAFFNSSAKRNKIIKYFAHSKQLMSLCETRWVERHESVLRFKSLFSEVIRALENISQWRDSEASSKATMLLNSLTTTSFITSLCILSDLLGASSAISSLLQKKALMKYEAENTIKNLKNLLLIKRENATEYLKNIFIEVSSMHESFGLPISKPRITNKQVNRNNITTSSPEEYYRISIYIPLLDDVLTDMNTRFNGRFFKNLYINEIIPSKIENKNVDELKELSLKIGDILVSFTDEISGVISSKLFSELEIWKCKWAAEKNYSEDSFFYECDQAFFPLINMALKIYGSLPISVATAERSFSTLRQLKTWLRSTMLQERLCGLALMHIHRDIILDANQVIDVFAAKKKRYMDLVI